MNQSTQFCAGSAILHNQQIILSDGSPPLGVQAKLRTGPALVCTAGKLDAFRKHAANYTTETNGHVLPRSMRSSAGAKYRNRFRSFRRVHVLVAEKTRYASEICFQSHVAGFYPFFATSRAQVCWAPRYGPLAFPAHPSPPGLKENIKQPRNTRRTLGPLDPHRG